MAIVQVGAIVAGLRVARRVEQIATELETGVKPLIANLTTLSAEASRAATLAAAQVERFDRLFTELTRDVDQTLAAAQQFVAGPAREGMAIVAGIRAAMTALQGMREASAAPVGRPRRRRSRKRKSRCLSGRMRGMKNLAARASARLAGATLSWRRVACTPARPQDSKSAALVKELTGTAAAAQAR